MKNNIFGNRLWELRKEGNIKQVQLAKELKISRQSLLHYETGKHEPQFDMLLTISNIFNVSTDYLLGFSNFRTHQDAVEFYEFLKNREIYIDSSVGTDYMAYFNEIFNSFDEIIKSELPYDNKIMLIKYYIDIIEQINKIITRIDNDKNNLFHKKEGDKKEEILNEISVCNNIINRIVLLLCE